MFRENSASALSNWKTGEGRNGGRKLGNQSRLEKERKLSFRRKEKNYSERNKYTLEDNFKGNFNHF